MARPDRGGARRAGGRRGARALRSDIPPGRTDGALWRRTRSSSSSPRAGAPLPRPRSARRPGAAAAARLQRLAAPWEPWATNSPDPSGSSRSTCRDTASPARCRTASTQKAMAGFVLEFASALGLDRFALGGNSMGGGVAARFAIDNPGRVTKLILIDAAGFPSRVQDDPGLGFRLARMPVVRNLLWWRRPGRCSRRASKPPSPTTRWCGGDGGSLLAARRMEGSRAGERRPFPVAARRDGARTGGRDRRAGPRPLGGRGQV